MIAESLAALHELPRLRLVSCPDCTNGVRFIETRPNSRSVYRQERVTSCDTCRGSGQILRCEGCGQDEESCECG